MKISRALQMFGMALAVAAVSLAQEAHSTKCFVDPMTIDGVNVCSTETTDALAFAHILFVDHVSWKIEAMTNVTTVFGALPYASATVSSGRALAGNYNLNVPGTTAPGRSIVISIGSKLFVCTSTACSGPGLPTPTVNSIKNFVVATAPGDYIGLSVFCTGGATPTTSGGTGVCDAKMSLVRKP